MRKRKIESYFNRKQIFTNKNYLERIGSNSSKVFQSTKVHSWLCNKRTFLFNNRIAGKIAFYRYSIKFSAAILCLRLFSRGMIQFSIKSIHVQFV